MEDSKQPPLSTVNDQPWYKKGLRFHCTQCGKCCTGPGFVWLTEEDIVNLSYYLKMSRLEFLKNYTRQIGLKHALLDHPGSDECIFLKNKKECSVYKSRPKQCNLFPWWPDHLKSKQGWEKAREQCEGIDHPDAPLIPLEEIDKHMS